MTPFQTFSGVAAPLLVDDIDTDQIAPSSNESRRLDPDYAALFFARRRFLADGSENPAFVLNRPQFRNASILVTGRFFGCGSARETSVWALAAFGIRCIVARSFAEMYRQNALRNGILPVTFGGDVQAAFEEDVVRADGREAYAVDLVRCSITAAGERVFPFSIAANERDMLLSGDDPVVSLLRHVDNIAQWERKTHETMPWLQETRLR